MRVLVTHAAGVLGFHAARRLLAEGHEVFAQVEPEDPFERARADALRHTPGLHVRDEPVEWTIDALDRLRAEAIVHSGRLRDGRSAPLIAADAAAHALFVLPQLLAAARESGTKHVLLRSSADVYGATEKLPFGVDQLIERHLSLEGAVFRSQELVAHAFLHAYGLPVTVLRFFSVFGPWGDANAPPMSFLRALRAGRPVELADGGQMRRDFVFIDDAVEAIVRAVERPPEPIGNLPHYAVHNVGTGTPTPLLRILELSEAATGRTAERREVAAPSTELPHTWADVRTLQQAYGFRPRTPLAEAIARTARWLEEAEAAAWRS